MTSAINRIEVAHSSGIARFFLLMVSSIVHSTVTCDAAAAGVDLTATDWVMTGFETCSGSWSGPLVFETQGPDGDGFALSGHFDWFHDGVNHGRELFSGTLAADGTVTVFGFKLVCAFGIVLGSYTAELSPEGDALINGVWQPCSGAWSAVPDSCGIDVLHDGTVGIVDLILLLGEWGECSEECPCEGDTNGDGFVGIVDFLAVLGAWGDCP